MASPVDAGRIVTQVATAVTPWTVNLPAGITAGDLLILWARAGTSLVGNSTPAGWTILLDTGSSRIYYKWASGSEGTSLAWTPTAAVKGTAIAWRITGAADPATQPPQLSSTATHGVAANAANPPAISPTGGSKDYLFLIIASINGETQAFTHSTYANVTNANSGTGGQATSNVRAAGASRQATTATEDPGPFTYPVADGGGESWTLAIHPAGPAGPATHYGATALAVTANRAAAATRKTFAAVAAPFTANRAVAGIASAPGVTHTGATSTTYALARAVQAQRKTFGQVLTPVSFTKAVQGQRRTFAQTAAPIVFTKTVQATRRTTSSITAPFVLARAVQATRRTTGVVARTTTTTITTNGVRWLGAQTHTGQTTATITIARAVQGRRRTYATLARPTTFTAHTNGAGTTLAPILNNATDIRWGTTQPDRVLIGTQEVWTP